jgi:hypothetical protein
MGAVIDLTDDELDLVEDVFDRPLHRGLQGRERFARLGMRRRI